MLNEDVMTLLNSLFKQGKIPISIKELILWRPVWHDPVFENFEPINDVVRLSTCNPLWFELRFEESKRDYEYHVECINHDNRFQLKSHMLKACELHPGEDPKKIEEEMEKTIGFLITFMLRVLDLFCKRG